MISGCFNKKNTNTINVEEKVNLPVSQSLDFSYSSGAGGWYTLLTLKPDGTFTGSYHDSEMGSIGEEYPNGTVYISEFEGSFADIKKINEYSYSIALENLNTAKKEGEQWIEDGVLYISSLPGGLEGRNFVFYTPDTPIEEVSDEFLIWKQTPQNNTTKLSVYGMYNQSSGAGFFSAE